MRTEAVRLESVMVRRARNNGASWAQIATVLGVSKQAVHKKHGGKGR
jgi:predicted transcriptional regulator